MQFVSAKQIPHQVLITGIRSDIGFDTASNSTYRYLELRFHINSNLFK
jgi:hypothetical protein